LRTRRLATAIAAAAGLLMLIVPGAAQAARGMEVAIQDDPIFTGGVPIAGFNGRDVGLGYSRELGVTRIRVNVGWASSLSAADRAATSAPSNPVYEFQRFDDLIREAKRWGIKVQFALNGPAPRWATGDGKEGPNKPDAKLYKKFVTAAVTHFKGRVDRYSVWNEPNHVGWISPVDESGTIYRKLYQAAYKEIKKRDKKAKVLIAETSPYQLGSKKRKLNAVAPLAFLRQLTCSDKNFKKSKCPGLKADGYAHHPYDFEHKPTYKFKGKDNATLATLKNLTRALDRMAKSKALRTPRGKALDLYLTEYGFFRQGKRAISEETRAKYLVQAFEIARKNKRVKQMLQYLVVEPGPGYEFFDTSLVTKDGAKTPTYDALRTWAQNALAKKQIKKQGKLDPTLGPPAPAPGSGGGGGGSGGGGSGGGTTPPEQPVYCTFPGIGPIICS
jgi:hypothetical protein